jgi:hypothetical protein
VVRGISLLSLRDLQTVGAQYGTLQTAEKPTVSSIHRRYVPVGDRLAHFLPVLAIPALITV